MAKAAAKPEAKAKPESTGNPKAKPKAPRAGFKVGDAVRFRGGAFSPGMVVEATPTAGSPCYLVRWYAMDKGAFLTDYLPGSSLVADADWRPEG